MTHRQRPLSPHLQIYRLPLTALISISHRVTGVLLTAGLLLMLCYLAALASGPNGFATLQSLVSSFIGQLILFGFNYALCFHLCHGVRHLVWDTGHSFEREHMDRIATFEITASVVLALFIWLAAALLT